MRRIFGLSIAAALVTVVVTASVRTAGPSAKIPDYTVDPTWPKPLPHEWVVGHVTGQELESDVALQPGVARAVDLSHTASAHERHDVVVREARADRQRSRRRHVAHSAEATVRLVACQRCVHVTVKARHAPGSAAVSAAPCPPGWTLGPDRR